jgi:hypothetical protein
MADTARITELLSETASAHHSYEQDELGGARDEEWAQWYADRLLEQGLAEPLGGSPSRDEVAEVLTAATEDQAAEGDGVEWSEYAATRLANELGA